MIAEDEYASKAWTLPSGWGPGNVSLCGMIPPDSMAEMLDACCH
jgi:hypothetical protein